MNKTKILQKKMCQEVIGTSIPINNDYVNVFFFGFFFLNLNLVTVTIVIFTTNLIYIQSSRNQTS